MTFTPFSPTDLAAMKERCEAASKGSWVSTDTEFGEWVVDIPADGFSTIETLSFGDMETNSGQDIANADFVAAARTDLPLLLDVLDAAYAEIERLRAGWIAEERKASAYYEEMMEAGLR